MQGTPPTPQGLPTPQAILLRSDAIGQLMFSGKQQIVLAKKQNVYLELLCPQGPKTTQKQSGLSVRFIPCVQVICALTLSTSRREVGAVTDW